jgi:hypothetical protein
MVHKYTLHAWFGPERHCGQLTWKTAGSISTYRSVARGPRLDGPQPLCSDRRRRYIRINSFVGSVRSVQCARAGCSLDSSAVDGLERYANGPGELVGAIKVLIGNRYHPVRISLRRFLLPHFNFELSYSSWSGPHCISSRSLTLFCEALP